MTLLVLAPLLYGSLIIRTAYCQSTGVLYDTPGSCSASAFFSAIDLECAACPANQSSVEGGTFISMYIQFVEDTGTVLVNVYNHNHYK